MSHFSFRPQVEQLDGRDLPSATAGAVGASVLIDSRPPLVSDGPSRAEALGTVLLRSLSPALLESAEQASPRLDLSLDRVSKFFSTLSNINQVISETQAQITANLK